MSRPIEVVSTVGAPYRTKRKHALGPRDLVKHQDRTWCGKVPRWIYYTHETDWTAVAADEQCPACVKAIAAYLALGES